MKCTADRKEKQKLAQAKIRALSVLQFPDSYNDKQYHYLLVINHSTNSSCVGQFGISL